LIAEVGIERFGANLLHDPLSPRREMEIAELYLHRGVRRVCASGYISPTPPLIYLRAKGRGVSIFAKVSRPEVATAFLEPPSRALLDPLVANKMITADDAEAASRSPLADEVTVEADSGGHTDGQPLLPLLLSMRRLRDRIARERGYAKAPRIGAAGGIGEPVSAAAALTAGAAYVLTGSINQACREAGTSALVKEMLAEAELAAFELAPAADLFEAGARVQVLKHRTLFAARAQQLYELYRRYESYDEIPAEQRQKIEATYFRRSIEEVWADVERYFAGHAPEQLARAATHPRHRLALILRWYLGNSSRWARAGLAERRIDFQIWAGPAAGAFNHWARGSFLERAEERGVVEVARNIIWGAATILRARALQMHGVEVPAELLLPAPRRAPPGFED
jgi:PfaD family protein